MEASAMLQCDVEVFSTSGVFTTDVCVYHYPLSATHAKNCVNAKMIQAGRQLKFKMNLKKLV